MKHFLVSLFAVILSLGLGVSDAEAKRLGGGSSFGMKRQIAPQPAPRSPTAAPQQSPQQGTPAGAQPRRSWISPIAGLAAGLGLAALFSHLGLGEELASFVMLALLAMAAVMLFRLLTRRSLPAQGNRPEQFAGAGAQAGPSAHDAAWQAGSANEPTPAGALPRDFDAEGFARQAKLNFIRLQAANDRGDLNDIREFTTPEVFAEIQLQLSERGPAPQRTDVVELDAQVLEAGEDGERYVVSVRFSGLLREEADAAPTPFDEVWHLVKPVRGAGGWLVAGIQQLA